MVSCASSTLPVRSACALHKCWYISELCPEADSNSRLRSRHLPHATTQILTWSPAASGTARPLPRRCSTMCCRRANTARRSSAREHPCMVISQGNRNLLVCHLHGGSATRRLSPWVVGSMLCSFQGIGTAEEEVKADSARRGRSAQPSDPLQQEERPRAAAVCSLSPLAGLPVCWW